MMEVRGGGPLLQVLPEPPRCTRTELLLNIELHEAHVVQGHGLDELHVLILPLLRPLVGEGLVRVGPKHHREKTRVDDEVLEGPVRLGVLLRPPVSLADVVERPEAILYSRVVEDLWIKAVSGKMYLHRTLDID